MTMTAPAVFRELTWAEARLRWDAWLGNFADRSARQSAAWAAHKTDSWRPRFFALLSGETPRALALALERRAPLGIARLAWVNAGPVCRRGGADDLAALGELSRTSARR